MSDDTKRDETQGDGLHRLWWTGLHIVSDELRFKVVEAYFRATILRTKLWVRRRDVAALADVVEDILNNHVEDLERTVEAHPWYGHAACERAANHDAEGGSDA